MSENPLGHKSAETGPEKAYVKIMTMSGMPAEATEVVVEKIELQNGKPMLRFHLSKGVDGNYKAEFLNGEWVAEALD